MRIKRIACVIVVLGLGVTPAAPHAQTPRAPGCTSAEFHVLDYWIGDWDVRTGDDQQAGSSRVEWSADGCSILERWTSLPGMPRFTGVGLHVYDPATKTYRQIWSDSRPLVVEMTGTPLVDGFRYDWKAPSPQGQTLDKRYTLTQTDGGGVRQLGERSADGGKTWVVEYEYRYRRR